MKKGDIVRILDVREIRWHNVELKDQPKRINNMIVEIKYVQRFGLMTFAAFEIDGKTGIIPIEYLDPISH